MIRNWFRAWLGIERIERYITSIEGSESSGLTAIAKCGELAKRIADLEELQHSNLQLNNQLTATLAEVRQLREMVVDPKTIPVQTRNSRQFRALVEQEP